MPNKIDMMNQAKLSKKANAATIQDAQYQGSMAKKSKVMFDKESSRKSPLETAIDRNTDALQTIQQNTSTTATVLNKTSKTASGESIKKDMKRRLVIDKEERAYRKSMLGFFDKLSKKFGDDKIKYDAIVKGKDTPLAGIPVIGAAIKKAKSSLFSKLMKIGLFGALFAGVLTGDFSRFIKMFAVAIDPLRNLKMMGSMITGFFEHLAKLPKLLRGAMTFLKNPAKFFKDFQLEKWGKIGKFVTTATTKIGDMLSAVANSKIVKVMKSAGKWVSELSGVNKLFTTVAPMFQKFGTYIMAFIDGAASFATKITGSFKALGALGKAGGAVGKVASFAGKGLKFLKAIPGLGTIIAIPLAVMKFRKGDVVGGFLELASGLASLDFTGTIGVGISIAIESYLLFRSFKGEDYQEKEKATIKKISKQMLYAVPILGPIIRLVDAFNFFKAGEKRAGIVSAAQGLVGFMPGFGILASFLIGFIDSGVSKYQGSPPEKKVAIKKVTMNTLRETPVVGPIIQLKEAMDLWNNGDKMGALKGVSRAVATIVPGGGLLFDRLAGMADWAAKVGGAGEFMKGLGSKGISGLQAGNKKAAELAKGVFGEVVDFKDTIIKKGVAILTKIDGFKDSITEKGSELLSKFKESKAGELVGNGIGKAKELAKGVFGKILNFKDTITEKGIAILTKIEENPLFAKATAVMGKLFDPITNMINTVFSGLTNVITTIGGEVQKLANNEFVKWIAEKFGFDFGTSSAPAPTTSATTSAPAPTTSATTSATPAPREMNPAPGPSLPASNPPLSNTSTIGDTVDSSGTGIGFSDIAGLSDMAGVFSSFGEAIIPAPSADSEGVSTAVSGVTSGGGGMSKAASKIYDTKNIRTSGWFSHKPKKITGSHDIKGRNNKFPQGLVPYKTDVNVNGVNKNVWHNFQGMVAEYNDKTGDGVQLNSAYRGLEEQAELYRTKPKGYAAKPGRSLHNWGFALDINSADANAMADTSSDLEQGQSIMERWGFYRPIKEKEPWHIQPKSLDEGGNSRFDFADEGEKLFKGGYKAPEIGDPVETPSPSPKPMSPPPSMQVGDPVSDIGANLPTSAMQTIKSKASQVISLSDETIMKLLSGQNKIAKDNQPTLNTSGAVVTVNARG